jgi:hypothetical protein
MPPPTQLHRQAGRTPPQQQQQPPMGRVSRALQRQAAAKEAAATNVSSAVVPPSTASPRGNGCTITTDPTQSTTQLALRLGFVLCMQCRRQRGSDDDTGVNVEGMDRVLAKAERRIQGMTPVQRDALWNKIEAEYMTERDYGDSNHAL